MGAPLAVIRMHWPHPCRRGATVAGASAHDSPPLPQLLHCLGSAVQCSDLVPNGGTPQHLSQGMQPPSLL